MFYTYGQNNSGGSFVINDKLTRWVIVEADSPAEADSIAEGIGIYFNGCANRIDCECCGDRWHGACGYDASMSPTIFHEHPQEYCDWFTPMGDVYCRVFHKDGLIQEYRRWNEDEPRTVQA